MHHYSYDEIARFFSAEYLTVPLYALDKGARSVDDDDDDDDDAIDYFSGLLHGQIPAPVRPTSSLAVPTYAPFPTSVAADSFPLRIYVFLADVSQPTGNSAVAQQQRDASYYSNVS